jgi:hypothetical protein
MGGFFIAAAKCALVRSVTLPPRSASHLESIPRARRTRYGQLAQLSKANRSARQRTTPVQTPHPFAFRAAAQPLQSTIEKIFDPDGY